VGGSDAGGDVSTQARRHAGVMGERKESGGKRNVAWCAAGCVEMGEIRAYLLFGGGKRVIESSYFDLMYISHYEMVLLNWSCLSKTH
jgi:hypothetical protein